MKATRCTQGFFLAILAAATCAWFLDSVPSLFLATVLAGFLVFRVFIFLRCAGSAASTVSIFRTAKPQWLRQGGMVSVWTTVKMVVPRGLSATVTDLPPPGAPTVQGSNESPVVTTGQHAIGLRYGMSCMSCGNISWRGVDLHLADPFFSLTIPFRGETSHLPVLRVDPAGRFQRREGLGIYGERDLERFSFLKSYGIRSFRDYIPGDDLRSIDWKLSAKHGKLFVREYSGLSGKYPLLVVDLPDSGVPSPPHIRDAVLGSALAAAREMSAGPQGCSLMVISGANLLAFLPDERSMQKIERALTELSSPQRAVRCFRALDPAAAEALRMRLAGDGAAQSGMGKRLLEIYTRFIPEIRPLPFDVQCARALGRRGETALHVLTTGAGDISHLATLGLHARRLGVEASLGLPDSMATPALVRRLRGSGYSIIRGV